MEYIAKETVLKMLNKIENAVEDGEGYQFNEWVGYVEELPTEEVQQIVHGYWKYISREYVCSVCDGISLRHKYPYCPWCNAKMDGKGVEE